MEIIENCCTVKKRCPKSTNQEKPANVKCIKRYVQPPRAQPFIPQTKYCPPKTPIDANTVYLTSYYSEKDVQPRPQPFKPTQNIEVPKGEFSKETTNNLSFKPVCGLNKAKPIVPRQRLHVNKGQIENVTTIRASYVPKHVKRPEPVLPCGQIGLSKGTLETKTTTLLSYLNPGPVEQLSSFKPQSTYCKPEVPAASETTQKLSFLPVQLAKKEKYPWSKKPIYKPPEVPIVGDTTYKKSYYENNAQKRESPVIQKDNEVFPCGAEFFEGTIYRDSFLPSQAEKVIPVRPSSNLKLSKHKMQGCTTNKLSFQPVKGEKRKPILPRTRKLMMGTEQNNNATTTQLSYPAKAVERPHLILPCGNIQRTDAPLEAKTTAALSYMSPGNVDQLGSFKPTLTYCRPQDKVESETVNMLSYQEWKVGPKEELPWAKKPVYKPPEVKIPGETVTHMSFPTPGYFVEVCCDNGEAVDECQGEVRGDHWCHASAIRS